MKRLINFRITAAGILIIISVSCSESFLDTEPKGVAVGTVMSSAVGVENLLVGAYNALYGFYLADPLLWAPGTVYADDAHKGEVANHPDYYIQIMTWEMPTNNRVSSEIWNAKYDGVSRANNVLDYLRQNQEGGNPISAQRAAEIEAEAKFLRAYFHFELTRVFEKIPYIKTMEEMDGMIPEEVPNDSEGWDDIEGDLQFAIDNLPDGHPKNEVGRPSKYAAMAMKARVHLFQQELDQAKPLLDAIINSGLFELADKFTDNYLSSTENNKESIFEIQCTIGEGNERNNALAQKDKMHQNGPAGFGWGYITITQNLFEAFQVTEDGLPVLDSEDRVRLENDYMTPSDQEFHPTDHLLDPRVDWTLARRGIPYLDWGVHEGNSWIRDPSEGHMMMKKWMQYSWEPAHSSNAQNARNYRAYRYAHVLLWRAEIAVEEGDLGYARELVNMVRERAQVDIPMGRCETYVFDGREIVVNENEPSANYMVNPYPVNAEAFSSQAEARKAVRLEQRLEFALEGNRFFDLRRWGIDKEKLDYFVQSEQEFSQYLIGKSYDPELDDYLPIPSDQIDLQRGVIVQDPAYN